MVISTADAFSISYKTIPKKIHGLPRANCNDEGCAHECPQQKIKSWYLQIVKEII
jgi:hypothetical protein